MRGTALASSQRTRSFAPGAARLVAAALGLGISSFSGEARATDVRLVGFASATPSLPFVTLRTDEVANYDIFTSGTLRIEYWFFPTPFTGALQFGYKTAETTLGQTVPLGLPPDGYYCPSFQRSRAGWRGIGSTSSAAGSARTST